MKPMPRKTTASSSPRVAIAIMAAGKGTRLKSKHPKVLHEVGGKPLLAYVIAAATEVVAPADIYVIIGHEAKRVRDTVAHTGVNFIVQEPQRGTGHALMVSRQALKPYDAVVVLSGDAPLITPATIQNMADFHLREKGAMTLLAAEVEDPTGYGRVVRKSGTGDEVRAIVEEKAATPAQRKIREINSGFYAFEAPTLFDNIEKLTTNNPHGEFYLTDMAEVLTKEKKRVMVYRTEHPGEILGTNTRAELIELDARVRMAKCRQLMNDGVTIFYPQSCVIDSDVEIGADTTIEPFVQILGNSRIGSDCRIRSYSVIMNSQLGDNVEIRQATVMDSSRISAGAIIGPFSHLRPGSDIGEGAHLGNFVEVKKTKVGKGSKANHLTYLGDTKIGSGVNVGAGTITCNYDGVSKYKTVIEDGVFVGSHATLVAPLKLGKGSYIAAASCLTEDVPEDALALGRSRQVVKQGWAREKRKTKPTR